MNAFDASLSSLPKLKQAEARRLALLLTDPQRLARRNLLDFGAYVDGEKFLTPRHLRLLAERLAQVERYILTGGAQGIGRLLVHMPPRHGKTQTASKRWPAFLLGRHPDWRLALVGYQAEIAADFSRANRELIETSAEYQALFPGVRVNSALSAVDRWGLAGADASHPSMVAVGVGGPLTGRGFNLIIMDDPIKSRAEAESQAYRDHLEEFYRGTLRTRLEPGGAIVIIMTRWHQDDLAGRLTDPKRSGGDRWQVLNLKAVAEAHDPLGRQPGEALWPERYNVAALDSIRAETSDYEWEAQYQQRPASPQGAAFRRDWFAERLGAELYQINRPVARYISWDTGLKDKDSSAYSACVIGELLPDYRLYIREVWRDKLVFPDLLPAIQRKTAEYNADGLLRAVLIEDKASGTSAYQTLMAGADETLKQLLIPFQPSGDKSQRAAQAGVWARNDCVRLPPPGTEHGWLLDFESELFAFPASAYKDQVDAFNQLVLYLEHLLADGYHARQGA